MASTSPCWIPPEDADRLFFGGARQRWKPDELADVRRVCDSCPVLFACLDAALAVPEHHDTFGVGGSATS